MKIQKLAPAICLALAGLMSSNVNANNISFSTPDVFFSFTNLNGPVFYLDGFDVPFQTSFGLSSLPQFDTNLGTLTGATINITGDLTVNTFLDAGFDAPDISLPHGLDATYSISVGAQTQTTTASCSAGVFALPCISDVTNTTFINTTNVFSGAGLAGFTGNGNLGAFGVDLLLTLDSFNLNNIDGPALDFEIDFSSTLVTVDYQFSAVPVPAAAWLFMSGLIGLAAPAMRRRV